MLWHDVDRFPGLRRKAPVPCIQPLGLLVFSVNL